MGAISMGPDLKKITVTKVFEYQIYFYFHVIYI